MSVFLPKVINISEYIIQRSVCQEPRSFSLQKVKKRNKEWPMWNKPRNTDSSEFTQNAVGRDNWQNNELHPMLFHSQFWCFYFRNKAHWTKHWRATVALFCVTSILHLKKYPVKINLHPFCETKRTILESRSAIAVLFPFLPCCWTWYVTFSLFSYADCQ